MQFDELSELRKTFESQLVELRNQKLELEKKLEELGKCGDLDFDLTKDNILADAGAQTEKLMCDAGTQSNPLDYIKY